MNVLEPGVSESNLFEKRFLAIQGHASVTYALIHHESDADSPAGTLIVSDPPRESSFIYR